MMTDWQLRRSVASCEDAGLRFQLLDGSHVAKADFNGVGATFGMRTMNPDDGDGLVMAIQTTPLAVLGSIGACIETNSELATTIKLTKHGRCGCLAIQWNIRALDADGVEYALAAYENALVVIESCGAHGARWHSQWDNSTSSPGFSELDEAIHLAKQQNWSEADHQFERAACEFASAELTAWFQRSKTHR